MSDERRPHFRFYPRAYEARGAFEASHRRCEVCEAACVWRYAGIIYTLHAPDIVCASCISTGRLRASIPGRMSLQDCEVDGAKPELQAELLERTPGVVSFNGFEWPVRKGMPLAFLGHGDDDALQSDARARDAVVRAGVEAGADNIAMPTPYALVFVEALPLAPLSRVMGGPAYKAVIDYD